ncbi:MAG: ABC transporter ATP-binding protein [Candidatus Bathyarchaeota archaeon]|jgi:ABC-2 type transport system ATP-binding protein|nr:ABC transporter ATP-binding protein [Candidatus Bathyarchaeota archaeon]
MMIETRKLTKRFNGLTAVDHVSFDVKRGEIFGLLGPNGAGKTTTIRMLATLTRPTEGTATVGDYDIVGDDNEVRRLIGLVSEKIIMYDRLTAKENLWFFGRLYDVPKEVLASRIDELLRLVQLGDWKSSQVGTFSSGMRQRMNVIRALLNMPEVLLLDEPTLGLDPQSSVEVREFVKKINRENKTTIILTTHMMVEADMLCDRIGIIDHGKIVALDTSANLKKLVSGADTTVLELEIANLTTDMVSSIRSLKCVSSVSQNDATHIRVHADGDGAFDTIIDAIRAGKGRMNSVKNLEPTLEDVFLHITGHEVRNKADRKIPVGTHRRLMARSRVR